MEEGWWACREYRDKLGRHRRRYGYVNECRREGEEEDVHRKYQIDSPIIFGNYNILITYHSVNSNTNCK